MRKRVEAVEVLGRILQQVELDQINQEVDAMSDERIREELAAEGYTDDKVDAVFAKQQAMLDDILADERRQRRQQALSYVGGVATAAAVALAVRQGEKPGPTVPTASTAAAARSPSALRNEAFEACGRGHWDDCMRLLDEARALDPAGENDRDVQQARRTATQRR